MSGCLTVVSFGGGTNSTALLIGMIERKEPAPHAIIFADTGGERPETYLHIRDFSAWLMERSYPAITTIRKGGNGRTLEQDCMIKNMLPSVAYGFKSCSHKFKIQPQEKWANNDAACRAEWAGGRKVVKLIGFDADEPHRAKPFDHPKFDDRYPLIEWGWGRAECMAAIHRAGIPQPGKSSCFYCPNSKPREIRDLARKHPDLAKRALQMEAGAHLTDIKGLGRYFAWRDLLLQDDLFEPPTSQLVAASQCDVCYDG